MNAERRKILLRSLLLCVGAVILLAAGMKIIDLIQQKMYPESRETGTDEFMQTNVVEWKGEKYWKTPGVTTILIAGIDQESGAIEGVSTSRYRNGGQADFLLLLAFDHTQKKIHQLQIDRDTMTNVTVLSVYGRETGSRIMQICLSHSYGANKEENARYTVRAVRGLMGDMEIDGCYMVDYSAVAVINDTLGGVTVTVPDDMTSVNPLWNEGSVVTLAGSEAESFVRARKTVGAGTNEERMRRQNEFMQKAILQMRARLSEDSAFGARLLTALKKKATTDLTDQQLLEEIQQSLRYEILPVEYLAGEYKIGESGYMEFYAQEDSPQDWIMRHLYYCK